jgi:uncharacterized protein (DUF2336 family)
MSDEDGGLGNPIHLEKILLSRKVGRFLCADQLENERKTVEHIARMLARDDNVQVRSVLSYGLRACHILPLDLARIIATDEVEVSAPFIEVTPVFDDEEMSEIVGKLREKTRVRLAGRSDVGKKTVFQLVDFGGTLSVSKLLQNQNVRFNDKALSNAIDRFGQNAVMMDHISVLDGLTNDIAEQIAWKVSKTQRDRLEKNFDLDLAKLKTANETFLKNRTASTLEFIFQKIDGASSAQVHAVASDLRSRRQLSHSLVLELSERGCKGFLESALALMAGLPIGQVREMLSLKSNKAFVKLMEMAEVDGKVATRYLASAKRFNKEQAAA